MRLDRSGTALYGGDRGEAPAPSADERSIDEILASIRNIIAEDPLSETTARVAARPVALANASSSSRKGSVRTSRPARLAQRTWQPSTDADSVLEELFAPVTDAPDSPVAEVEAAVIEAEVEALSPAPDATSITDAVETLPMDETPTAEALWGALAAGLAASETVAHVAIRTTATVVEDVPPVATQSDMPEDEVCEPAMAEAEFQSEDSTVSAGTPASAPQLSPALAAAAVAEVAAANAVCDTPVSAAAIASEAAVVETNVTAVPLSPAASDTATSTDDVVTVPTEQPTAQIDADGAHLVPNPTEQAETFEETVAGMLRPLLREWLDTNMPRMVEKAFREEATAIAKPGDAVLGAQGHVRGAAA